MKPLRNKYLILNYIFIFCVVILFLNDHFFKPIFSSWFTGKLSDMVGIIILPLILTYIFPKLKIHSVWISALLFAFWKSPYSGKVIEMYNKFTLIPITRVVDYSDLSVIVFLPVSYYLIKKINRLNLLKIQKINPAFILFPTGFVLMATAPPPSFSYTYSNGNLNCRKCVIRVAMTQKEIVDRLKENQIVFDTIYPMSESTYKRYPFFKQDDIHFYTIKKFVIDKDTLKNVDFAMRSIGENQTMLHFNGLQTSDDISTIRLFVKARKHYSKIIFKELSDALENKQSENGLKEH